MKKVWNLLNLIKMKALQTLLLSEVEFLFFMYFLMLLDKFYNNFNKKLLLELLIFIIILICFKIEVVFLYQFQLYYMLYFSISIKYKAVFFYL